MHNLARHPATCHARGMMSRSAAVKRDITKCLSRRPHAKRTRKSDNAIGSPRGPLTPRVTAPRTTSCARASAHPNDSGCMRSACVAPPRAECGGLTPAAAEGRERSLRASEFAAAAPSATTPPAGVRVADGGSRLRAARHRTCSTRQMANEDCPLCGSERRAVAPASREDAPWPPCGAATSPGRRNGAADPPWSCRCGIDSFC